ncbi:MAG: arginine--tRNA ligase, partial [Miltoncostaeaceae bacterium]
IEVAGPGFLNITLSPSWFVEALRQIERDRRHYGGGFADPPESILLEYVSANPTGPPHVGHARHAAYGDSLARMLSFAGHDVTREYYVNDHGRQIEMFARSIIARYAALFDLDVEVPEDGYRGDYVDALAARIREDVGEEYRDRVVDADDETVAWFGDRGVALMLDAIREDLSAFRTRFDAFSSERGLHVGGRVEHCLEALEAGGSTYEQDGATWFRTTSFGDEKDRVLVRSDGSCTYLASDVAYHLDKAARGHDRLIDVLGADHHGYIARLKAILAADGHDPDTLEVPIMQLVSLVERGVAKKMSKRAGTLVLLGELVDDIGVDAARFFLVQRSHDTALELDLDLAREQSQENPVYYVQYAHARVCSILAQAEGAAEDGSAPAPAELDPAERALALRIAGWPEAVSAAVDKRAPHRVAAYSIDLARDLHAFYHRCRVVGEAPEVQAFRLSLVRATRTVLAVALDLLGVEAPERM